MAIAVEMPDMGPPFMEKTNAGARLLSWLADEGDRLVAEDVIAQVETRVATMDLEVYDDCTLLKRVVNPGDWVTVGSLVAVLGEPGESIAEVLAGYPEPN